MQVQVTQSELQQIFELERDVAPKLKRIDELKQNVKILLVHKLPVELGRFDAHLVKRMHRHVPWRQAVVETLGADFADTYKKRFPVRMFCEVAVEEHAVLPLWKTGGDNLDVAPDEM